jgi:transposase
MPLRPSIWLNLNSVALILPAQAGRRIIRPRSLLRLYIYGYLNRVHSSRRLEREAGRNVEGCARNRHG